jgi:hypothetical protein
MSNNKVLLNKFDTTVKSLISASLEACIEAEGDDWSVYDGFKEHLADSIKAATESFVASLVKTSNTKVAASSGSKTTKSGAPRKVAAYPQWIKLASAIAKDSNEPAGDEEFVVEENFSSRTSSSAVKYSTYDLGLAGQTMSVRKLLNTLKECLPEEKSLAIAAIGWGLMPKAFREGLVA